MQIIIPMAGQGKRMRPHTLTTPKPLIHVAGKPIVQRLVEDITRINRSRTEEIAFVISPDFGTEVEQELLRIAESQGARGKIYYQEEALGTAHAIMCAAGSIKGNTIVAFADTLFTADFLMDEKADGVIWVQKVNDPSQFGVVKTGPDGLISDFAEKPEKFVSDLAIIGIYYFKDGDVLKKELQYLLDNNIRDKGEYQLTTALENMKQKNMRFMTGEVKEWLDCGNKNATVFSNRRLLEHDCGKPELRGKNITLHNTVLTEPCFIGDGVEIHDSVIGPHASIGASAVIKRSIVSDSIVQKNANIEDACVTNSMIGAFTRVKGKGMDLSISDYSQIIL